MPAAKPLLRVGQLLLIAGICAQTAPSWGGARSTSPLEDILARSYQRSRVDAIIGQSAREKVVPARRQQARQRSAQAPAGSRLNSETLGRVERFGDIIDRHSDLNGLDADLVKAVIYVESGGDSQALSPRGATGLMQLMPATGAALGARDLFDPEQNIASGTRYLGSLLQRYKSEGVALWAYNAGPGSVEKERMPRETRNYVPRVLRLRRHLKAHAGD